MIIAVYEDGQAMVCLNSLQTFLPQQVLTVETENAADIMDHHQIETVEPVLFPSSGAILLSNTFRLFQQTP